MNTLIEVSKHIVSLESPVRCFDNNKVKTGLCRDQNIKSICAIIKWEIESPFLASILYLFEKPYRANTHSDLNGHNESRNVNFKTDMVSTIILVVHIKLVKTTTSYKV